jgi:hypothetical protein
MKLLVLVFVTALICFGLLTFIKRKRADNDTDESGESQIPPLNDFAMRGEIPEGDWRRYHPGIPCRRVPMKPQSRNQRSSNNGYK